MTTLNLHDFSKVVQDSETSKSLFNSVVEGMAPFRLKQVDIYCEYDIDYHEYRIVAGAVLLSGYTFSHSERIGAWDLSDYPTREYARVAKLMFNAFRNRADLRGVPSNIVLGEY